MLIHLPVYVKPLKEFTQKQIAVRQKMWTGGREPVLEATVQALTTRYMKTFYHGRQFRVSPFGLNLSNAQAATLKSHNLRAGWHDMEVYEPSGLYSGLCLELKKKGVRVKNKKGNFASQHLADQYHNILQMRRCTKAAGFTVGLEDTIKAIDLYFCGQHLALSELLSKFDL